MEEGICKFCGEHRELQKSHIIPKFVFTAMLNTEKRLEVKQRGRRARNIGKGDTERMLCDECEGIFSRWESPASWLVKGSCFKPHRHWIDDNGNERVSMSKWKANKYIEIKLFVMSYLWRVHQSSLDGFRDFELESKMLNDFEKTMKEEDRRTPVKRSIFGVQAERLRVSGALRPESYPVVIFVKDFIGHEGRSVSNITIPPVPRFLDEGGYSSRVICYEFHLSDLVFFVYTQAGYLWSKMGAGGDAIDTFMLRPGLVTTRHWNEKHDKIVFEAYVDHAKGLIQS